jgi:hypothetical protein
MQKHNKGKGLGVSIVLGEQSAAVIKINPNGDPVIRG